MAESIARIRFVRIAPRKVRLVADLIRGRKVSEARDILRFTMKRAAPVLGKLLESAVANAETAAAERRHRIDADDMVVNHISVDGGPAFKRVQPRAQGRRTLLRKRTSHVQLRLTGESAPIPQRGRRRSKQGE
ncbi:MAG: 50S ribosomal protein L22 [Candidatus Hydrogenedentes bacterium]|nr:50S ribosomal protein L22 [Candidatus Hydrogenedentota bacterium]